MGWRDVSCRKVRLEGGQPNFREDAVASETSAVGGHGTERISPAFLGVGLWAAFDDRPRLGGLTVTLRKSLERRKA